MRGVGSGSVLGLGSVESPWPRISEDQARQSPDAEAGRVTEYARRKAAKQKREGYDRYLAQGQNAGLGFGTQALRARFPHLYSSRPPD